MRFTKDAVLRLAYDAKGPETQQVWGSGEDKNLGIALSPKGDHVWIARVYVVQPDQTTKKRIGRLFRRPLTIADKSLDEARHERDIWKVEAAQGLDPLKKRRPEAGKANPADEVGVATIAILLDTFRREHSEKELEHGTQKRYGKLFEHIKQHLGEIPAAELTKAHVNDFRRAMEVFRPTFNQARKLLISAYKLADRLDWTYGGQPMVPSGFQPVSAVLPYDTAASRKKSRAFEPAEVEAIFAAAMKYLVPRGARPWGDISRSSAALPLLLFLTGLRKEEGIGLSWKNLDLPKSSGWRGWIDRRLDVIQLVHHKTSRKRGPRVVPISPQAWQVLDLMEGCDETWVLPGNEPNKMMWSPDTAWHRLQREAGITRPCGLHHTRHTYITRALEAGAPIGAVAKAVGHSTTYITENYSHVSDRAAKSAADLVGTEMLGAGWEWLKAAA